MSPVERTNTTPNGATRKARRHAMIMRGVVTPVFGLLAIAAVAVGALNATVWKPSRVIDAAASVTGTRYVVTDPTVLGLVDSNVKVAVDAKGDGDVCVALASSKDASGWLSGESYTRLTGLSDWTTLSTSKEPSGGKVSAGESDVAFKDSDMWRDVACGKGSATMKAKSTSGADVALIDLGKSSVQAKVSFTWTRQTLPDYATPMYFAGGLLAVLAVLTASVFAMPPHKRRNGRIVESSGAAGTAMAHDAQENGEVTIGEAVAGSLGGLKPSFAPKGRRRRRHAAGASNPPQPVGDQPVVVDPSARNLVADAAAGAAGAGTAAGPAGVSGGFDPAEEVTSVISTDELQAYFARLAQEVGADDAADAAAGDSDAADRNRPQNGTGLEGLVGRGDDADQQDDQQQEGARR